MGEIGKAVGQWIVSNVPWTVVIILFILSIFFKIPKKEVNVLGWLVSWIGGVFTRSLRQDIEVFRRENEAQYEDLKRDTNEKISSLEDSTTAALDEMRIKTDHNCQSLKEKLSEIEAKQDKLEEKQDLQSASRIRAHVLNFARSLYNGERHTREDFENLIKENEEYEALTAQYGWKNDRYRANYKYVEECYNICIREHSFLAE